jgi:hypothetical protein
MDAGTARDLFFCGRRTLRCAEIKAEIEPLDISEWEQRFDSDPENVLKELAEQLHRTVAML